MPGKKARRPRRLARLEQEAELREASTASHTSSRSLETQEEPAPTQVLEDLRTRLWRASQELLLPLVATSCRNATQEELPSANPYATERTSYS